MHEEEKTCINILHFFFFGFVAFKGLKSITLFIFCI